MTSSRKANPAALDALNKGIEKANFRDQANPFSSRFSKDAAVVLFDIWNNLRDFLIDEKGLNEIEAQKLAAQLMPGRGLRTVSPLVANDGIRLALEILNSLASVFRIQDGQYKINGKALSRDEVLTLLLSGMGGLKNHRHMQRQKEHAKKGSEQRSEERRSREAQWVKLARPLRAKYPGWSNAQLAKHVARLPGVLGKENTIRQALTRLGLSKKG